MNDLSSGVVQSFQHIHKIIIFLQEMSNPKMTKNKLNNLVGGGGFNIV